MGIIILGKFLWKMFAPVLSFRRLSAKTLAAVKICKLTQKYRKVLGQKS